MKLAAITLSRLATALCAAYFLNAAWRCPGGHFGYVWIGALWLWASVLLGRLPRSMYIAAVTMLIMVLWGAWTESTPFSDFASFVKHASSVASGDLRPLATSKSPSTVIWYAGCFALLGAGTLATHVAASAAWTLGAWAWGKAAEQLGAAPIKSRTFQAALGLLPSQLVFSPVVSSESVFFLLSGLAAAFAARATTSRHVWPAFACGLLLGCTHLARSTAAVLIPPIGLVLLCTSSGFGGNTAGRCPRRGIVLLSAIMAGFALLPIGFGAGSFLVDRGFRLSPSPWGSHILLFGTNESSKGGYSKSDLELTGAVGAEGEALAASSAKARDLAWSRIAGDPARFLRFALTSKIERFWGQTDSFWDWAASRSPRYESINQAWGRLVRRALGGTQVLVLLLSAGLFVFYSLRPTVLATGAAAACLGFASIHVFIEVQVRYHLPLLPPLIGIVIFTNWTTIAARLRSRASRSVRP